MSEGPTHYGILQVAPDADQSEIRAAYRRLVRDTHPDVNGGNAHFFTLVKEAYDVLSDPQRRAAYDASLTGQDPQARSQPDADVDAEWGAEADWHEHDDTSADDVRVEDPPPRPSPSNAGSRPQWMDDDLPGPPPAGPHMPTETATTDLDRQRQTWLIIMATITLVCAAPWLLVFPYGTGIGLLFVLGIYRAVRRRLRGSGGTVGIVLSCMTAGFVAVSVVPTSVSGGTNAIFVAVSAVFAILYAAYVAIAIKTWYVLGHR